MKNNANEASKSCRRRMLSNREQAVKALNSSIKKWNKIGRIIINCKESPCAVCNLAKKVCKNCLIHDKGEKCSKEWTNVYLSIEKFKLKLKQKKQEVMEKC